MLRERTEWIRNDGGFKADWRESNRPQRRERTWPFAWRTAEVKHHVNMKQTIDKWAIIGKLTAFSLSLWTEKDYLQPTHGTLVIRAGWFERFVGKAESYSTLAPSLYTFQNLISQTDVICWNMKYYLFWGQMDADDVSLSSFLLSFFCACFHVLFVARDKYSFISVVVAIVDLEQFSIISLSCVS